MAILEEDHQAGDSVELERQRQIALRELDLRRQKHEERMLEIKVVETARGRAKTRRLDVLERVLVALVKLLPLLLLMLLMPLWILRRQEVPKHLQEFMQL